VLLSWRQIGTRGPAAVGVAVPDISRDVLSPLEYYSRGAQPAVGGPRARFRQRN
jgi:hypothetical protein